MLDAEVLQVHKIAAIALRQRLRARHLVGRYRYRHHNYRTFSHAGVLPFLFDGGARSLSHASSAPHLTRLSQRKDRQVQRDHDRHNDYTHHHQDDRLYQRQCSGQGRLHILFKELRHGVQHLRQRTRGLAHLDHRRRQLWKHLRPGQRIRQRLALAHTHDRRLYRLRHNPARDRSRRRLQRWHRRHAAFEQRRKCPRKLRHLVLHPDIAEDRHLQPYPVNAVRPAVCTAPPPYTICKQRKHRNRIQDVGLEVPAQRQQEQRQCRQFSANLVIQLPKTRHHKGDQEDEHRDHHDHQQRRIKHRSLQLLAKRQRDPLEVQIPPQHIFQVAATLPRQQGRRINRRKTPLRLECLGRRLAGANALRHALQLRLEGQVLLALRQHLQRGQNRHTGADQRQKLLVEDQKALELDLLLASAQPPSLYRIDVISGLREARAQLFR